MPSAEAPVDHVEDAEHAGDQQDAADGLGDDLAEEVGDRRDVAVDALDQLAGRVPAVELVVEAEHVAGDAQAQLVRRAPGGDGREAGDGDGDDLGGDGDGEEQQGQADELGRRAAVGRRSTIRPHDERAGQRQRRADARSAPRTAQRRASGRSRASRARPRDGGVVGTRPVSRGRPRRARGFLRRARAPGRTRADLVRHLAPEAALCCARQRAIRLKRQLRRGSGATSRTRSARCGSGTRSPVAGQGVRWSTRRMTSRPSSSTPYGRVPRQHRLGGGQRVPPAHGGGLSAPTRAVTVVDPRSPLRRVRVMAESRSWRLRSADAPPQVPAAELDGLGCPYLARRTRRLAAPDTRRRDRLPTDSTC